MSGRRLTFHLIPHTHWDREWYLPRAGFQARLARTAAALATLLRDDPTSKFTLDGQTVLLDDAAAVRPDLVAGFNAAVAEGRLAVGPWYVLADEQIPAGESLIRNLLIGTNAARRAGRRLDVLYSPDAFGHPAALPMLAREFGIGVGVAWRGLGGSRETGDLYRWRSPSGDELLLYHLPPQGYEIGADLLDGGGQLAATWRGIREPLVGRALSNHVAVFLGADHHAPPLELAPLRASIKALEKEHEVVISTLGEFATAITSRQGFPRLHGELRWSYGYTWALQGVHATRARMKRRHSMAELALSRSAEPLAALVQPAGGTNFKGLLHGTWRALVESQFHDTLAGCCSDAVAEEQSVRLASVETMTGEIRREALTELTGHDPDRARRQPHYATPTLVLWNPLTRSQGNIITASITCFRRDVLVGPPTGRIPSVGPGFQPFALVTASGEPIPVQVLEVTAGMERLDAPRHYPDQDEVDHVVVAFAPPPLGGLEFTTLRLAAGDDHPTPSALEVTEAIISNQYVSVTIGDTGVLHLTDRRTGEEYPDLLHLEDQVDLGDSYSVYLPEASKSRSGGTPHSRTVVAKGPLLASVEVSWILPLVQGTVAVRLRVELRADSPLVRLHLAIDNQASDHRLRARFPVGTGDEAVAGAAFGFERRPAEAFDPADYPAECPVLTAPAHRYVAVGSGTRGLAVFAPGFFEYEWTPRRDLLVTLFRAVGELSRADLATRPGHAGWPMPTPLAQEVGIHHVELVVIPMSNSDLDHPEQLESAWEDAFLPIEGHFIRDFTGPLEPPISTGITLEGKGLVCSAIKPSEDGDGMILRCFNATDHPVEGRWLLQATVGGAQLARADETPGAPLTVTPEGAIGFTAPPRRIVTILVSRP